MLEKSQQEACLSISIAKSKGMSSYLISKFRINTSKSAYSLRNQALEETDLLSLWHLQFLKNGAVSQKNGRLVYRHK